MKSVLIGVQTLLSEPNLKSPAQAPAYQLLATNPREYAKKIKEQATRYTDRG